MTARRAFDLSVPAPNGLMRGRTTGSCATAAVKAALLQLLDGRLVSSVEISLPDPDFYLDVPVDKVWPVKGGMARAEVIKYAGDDPDTTQGATIFAEVRRNDSGQLRYLAAEGVGTVTAPGLRIPPGEAAINPVPRQMMRLAVDEVLAGRPDPGFDLAIGCIDGARIARRTFNPLLGIVGGISILGTSGIVEPMSLAAWIASIEVYIRVALGDSPPPAIALTPGKIGRGFAAETLQLAKHQVVQIANFMGDSLDHTEAILQEQSARLDTLWVLGHPGKLAKLLDGSWDTHSSKSPMAMQGVAQFAARFGFEPEIVLQIEKANTVENVIQILQPDPRAQAFWQALEGHLAGLMHPRVPSVDQLQVRLFSMDGTPLGEAA
ncbi:MULTISPECIES: cobalt-precorrin-5B (C(1))-methyltransferase CbiD [unclassified Paludibacterium]|uniref:cobalt-precorrin-5B (C(1))-methyltransferase CbiD n=1 Tax=unclassified Paludibacterium TaxID=2618429 RepID=UPI001C05305D|nr:cobalt-precorrin-5B (C(1))-methyltransferase CbiD [Paludibacterium sp. B53371]BEV70984.1 cobalt-precorrin-5B (C(1))-methyltransferase CbiD [Paludibacterium sp. THUN1379]